MAGGHFLRPKGDNQENWTLGGCLSAPPVAEHLDRQLVGPLAVIQQNERRPARGAQGIQERSQRLNAACFRKFLRPQRSDRRCAE